MGGLLGSLLSAGGGLVDTGLDFFSAKQARELDWRHQQQMMNWQTEMSDTAHQREVNDLRKAGLNPILSAGGGGASVPGGSAPSSQVPKGSHLAQAVSSAQQFRLESQRVSNETQVADAQAQKLRHEGDLAQQHALRAQRENAELFPELVRKLVFEIMGTQESTARTAREREKVEEEIQILKTRMGPFQGAGSDWRSALEGLLKDVPDPGQTSAGWKPPNLGVYRLAPPGRDGPSFAPSSASQLRSLKRQVFDRAANREQARRTRALIEEDRRRKGGVR